MFLGRTKSKVINSSRQLPDTKIPRREGFPLGIPPLSCPLRPPPCLLLLASSVKCRLPALCPQQCARLMHLSSPSCFFSRTQALQEAAGERREESRCQDPTLATEEPLASPREPAAARPVQAASTMNLEKAGKGKLGYSGGCSGGGMRWDGHLVPLAGTRGTSPLSGCT